MEKVPPPAVLVTGVSPVFFVVIFILVVFFFYPKSYVHQNDSLGGARSLGLGMGTQKCLGITETITEIGTTEEAICFGILY